MIERIKEFLRKAIASSSDPVAQLSHEVSPQTGISNAYLTESAEGGGVEATRGLSYGQLYAMSKVPLISAIIQTRVNQMAEFTQAQMDQKHLGFQIRMKDRMKEPTDEELTRIREITEFMETCGDDRIAYENSFESFMRMLVRDSLTYDQACFEIVRNRKGEIAGFTNVDSSTIRRSKMSDSEIKNGRRDPLKAHYVQIMNNKPVAEFGVKDLCFGIRRPRSDHKYRGYGYPELEDCVKVITQMLNAEQYNASNFQNGISTSGVLAVKTRMNPQLFRVFRREFYSMLSGTHNAKKTPLIQLDPDAGEDIKNVNLSNNNRDMEFQEWMNHQIRTLCAIFQIDSTEVGFHLAAVSRKGYMLYQHKQSPAEKVLLSKEKGLRPLIRAVQTWINKYIVSEIDDRFELVFTGMEAISPAEQLDIDIKKARNFMTINEIRAMYDLQPLEHGDVVIDSPEQRSEVKGEIDPLKKPYRKTQDELDYKYQESESGEDDD